MSLRLVTGRATVGLRRLTARHRWTRWIPSLACGVGLVVSAHASTNDAEATRDAWGRRRPVWVASREIEPGTPIDAVLTELPTAAVPESALTGESPVGKIAVQRVSAGETLTAVDVGDGGALSLLPAGWRAVAVIESPASGAAPGDQVDVVSEGIVLAEAAIVLEHTDDATLVGAPADIAPLIALASETEVALLRTGRVGIPLEWPRDE